MPNTLLQWIVFAAVVVAGVIVSFGVQWVVMAKILEPIKVAKKTLERAGLPFDSQVHRKLKTRLQGCVGAIEIILYASSIVFGQSEFIAVWLATKYIAGVKTWGDEPVGRTFYNRSLFGSGLNILLGAITGGLAKLAILHTGHSLLPHIGPW